MRYLPIDKIKPGMALAQDVFDGEGSMLLSQEQVLHIEQITHLNEMGYQGFYIQDPETDDIIVEEVIRPEIKGQMLQLVHGLFENESDEQERNIRRAVERAVEDLLSNGDIMFNMLNLRNYDEYTYFHSVNVAILAVVIGVRFGMNEHQLRYLAAGGLLHDIGKKFLEISILNARRSLNEEERRIMLQHPKLGYEFIRDNFDFEQEVLLGVLEHHECYNGEGYPMRKSGDEISIYGRIIKLADVYDAMTAKRPYRNPMLPSDVLEYVMAGNGSEFDPQLVSVFVHWIAVYPVGCEVELSDRRIAIVKHNYEGYALRPLVKIKETGEDLDLGSDVEARSITIIRLIV